MAHYYNERDFQYIKAMMKKYIDYLCLSRTGSVYAIKGWEHEKVERPVRKFGFKTSKTETRYLIKKIYYKTELTEEGFVNVLESGDIIYFPLYIHQVQEARNRFIKLTESLKTFNFEITEIKIEENEKNY